MAYELFQHMPVLFHGRFELSENPTKELDFARNKLVFFNLPYFEKKF